MWEKSGRNQMINNAHRFCLQKEDNVLTINHDEKKMENEKEISSGEMKMKTKFH